MELVSMYIAVGIILLASILGTAFMTGILMMFWAFDEYGFILKNFVVGLLLSNMAIFITWFLVNTFR